jgi:hypothetical protein
MRETRGALEVRVVSGKSGESAGELVDAAAGKSAAKSVAKSVDKHRQPRP